MKYYTGSHKSEKMNGTNGDDYFSCYGGNDTVYAKGGNDSIFTMYAPMTMKELSLYQANPNKYTKS